MLANEFANCGYPGCRPRSRALSLHEFFHGLHPQAPAAEKCANRGVATLQVLLQLIERLWLRRGDDAIERLVESRKEPFNQHRGLTEHARNGGEHSICHLVGRTRKRAKVFV